jgi:acetamidase/formamidase
MATHFLDDSHPLAFWDRTLPSRVEIDPRDTVVFKTREGTAEPGDVLLTRTETAGYFVTTAHGPDLFANSQNAVRYMLDHLVAEHGVTREQAYCISGADVDLRISEIVDEPNYIVSTFPPLSIFVR